MPPRLKIQIPSQVSRAVTAKLQPLFVKAMMRSAPQIRERIISLTVTESRAVLKSSGESYRRALTDPKAIVILNDGLTVTILDALVRAIETGASPFDIKEKMLSRRRVKRGRRGLYIDVPLDRDRPIIRRISENSKPNSWIHPGFKPAKILQRITQQVRTDAKAIIRNELQREGFKVRVT